ncbi:hypothetical protein JCM10212_002941 [Sporobolomyces blumeae]
MSKRSRDPADDPRSGPSKNQLRGLAYVGQKPAFLQNALTALAGGSQRKAPAMENGRPAIPTRPDGEESDGHESDEDAWDLGRGDEAPAVVVLKEGKHLERDEVDRLRAQGKADGTDPLLSTTAPEPERNKGSLSFSSGSASKSKAKGGGGEHESWDEVVKRSKRDAEAKQQDKEQKEIDAAKQKEREDKKRKKEKKAAKEKIAKLSFSEE